MKLIRTESFKRDWRRLPQDIKPRARKALHLLVTDIKHPSLGIKKVQGTKTIWEGRVTLRYRLTFEIRKGALILRRIGSHKTMDIP